MYCTSVLLAVVIGFVGVFLASGSLGVVALIVMDGSSTLGLFDFIGAGYNYLPFVLFFIGLASLVLGYAQRLGKAVYIYLTYSFILNYFGGILDLQEWFSKTAIQSWIPQMPLENFNFLTFFNYSDYKYSFNGHWLSWIL